MNILALNTDEGIGIYGGKLVYSAQETQALRSCLETADYIQGIKADTNKQLALSKQNASEQGFEQGLQQGQAQASQELAAALLVHQQTLKQAQQALRDKSVVIALEVVKKIASNLATEQVVLSLAQTAAKELAPDSAVTLRTHSNNVKKIQQRLMDNKHTATQAFIDIVGDDTLAEDGCVLDTAIGSIEADLTTQLAAIEQHLSRE